MKKKNGNRSFFGRLVVFLLTVLALIGLVAMAMSVMCSYFDPVKYYWLAYFGLAFWAILFFNIAVWLMLMLMWSRRAWLSVIAFLIAIPGIVKSFSIGQSQGEGDLSVMTYNVYNFNYLKDEMTQLESATQISEMVKEQDPDVLCIQEFAVFMPKTGRTECIQRFGEMVGMPHHYYNDQKHFGGNVIFSRFPLAPVTDEGDFGKDNPYGTTALVDAGEKGAFTVVCCHLTSYHITAKEINVFTDRENSKEEVKSYGKSIFSKLKTAYQSRSEEVRKMLEDVPHDGRAIILCGDFNDTPLSYTYHQIKRAGFFDGFVRSGRGVGRTYAGKLPMLRIDYVWGNERICPMSFKRLKVKGSDHFPVMMEFSVDHGL